MKDTPHRLQESERRRATILFADISGFTAMSERMDPEEVTVIMNDCFRMMGAIVSRHEGTIDKYIGDCMMALFGVPVAVEDAPWKAVNTAIEIRNGLERINRDNKIGMPLSIHIGINTGTVVAGSMGADEKKDYTVMGAPVNYASRLKDAAGKGRIFVGPLTLRVTRNDFAYAKLESVSLKGGCKTLPVFEVLSVREKNRRARYPGRAISSPMVGRDRELETAINRGDGRETKKLRAASKRSTRAAVRNAAKYAANRTEAERLMGVHLRLCGRQGTAIKWLERSIMTGERAGARPELARTYLEIGKRLLEKTDGHRKLDGMKTGDYLKRAETLFTEMGLEWDLRELAKIREMSKADLNSYISCNQRYKK